MGKYWPVAVEVIAFLTFFATSMLEIITQKYIYNTAAKDEHANTNKHYFCKTSQNTECCNSTDIGINMQRSIFIEYWLLYINLASLLMAIPSTILLGIWSEIDGRKVVITVSLLGTVLRVALFIIILQFQESFYFFVIASLITSTLGYNTSLMASSVTFIADITNSGQRTLRIVFLDCAKGFGIGLAYFISSFYFECNWFQHFLWLVLVVSIFNITYVAFFLEETILTNESAPMCSCNYFVAIYKLFSFDPGNGRRWRLLTFAIALFIVGLVTAGTNNLLILYAQTSLCFTLVWTAYLYGALTLRFAPSLVGVKLLQTITKISNNWLIEAGLLSFLAGLVLAAFSNTTRLFFNVPAFQFLGAMPLAVIKGSMSRLVEPQEQGTLFAVVSCLESSACFLGVFIFRHLYQPTSDVFPGFSFVIGAFLLIIPAVLVGIIHRNEDPTRNLFYQDESSEADFGRQCSISTRSTSNQRICGVPVVTNGDLSSCQEYSIVTNEDQGISF